jgi:uncharacterized protein
MRLHNMLDGLMDSGSKVRIMRLLFRSPSREFTEREIASQIKMSPNTVNLALRDLTETNVFHFKRIGKTHIYSCNKNSVLYPFLFDIFKGERRIIDLLTDSIREALAGTELVLIYGSFAKGEEEAGSDIDVLVVTKDKVKARNALEKLNQKALDQYATPLSYAIYTIKEFKKNRDKPFIRNALAEGLTIIGNGGQA